LKTENSEKGILFSADDDDFDYGDEGDYNNIIKIKIMCC
jgi:hypothetical protein